MADPRLRRGKKSVVVPPVLPKPATCPCCFRPLADFVRTVYAYTRPGEQPQVKCERALRVCEACGISVHLQPFPPRESYMDRMVREHAPGKAK